MSNSEQIPAAIRREPQATLARGSKLLHEIKRFATRYIGWSVRDFDGDLRARWDSLFLVEGSRAAVCALGKWHIEMPTHCSEARWIGLSSNMQTVRASANVVRDFEDLPSGVPRRVIPVIPFCLEFGRIRETVETVPEVANLLETRENTDYHA